MALKKDFASGTKYYYVRISNIIWTKGQHIKFSVDRRVRDTGDVNVDYTESEVPFMVEVDSSGVGLPDSNDRWSTTNLDVVSKNFIGECYEFLKSDVEEYKTGWTDV